MMPSHISTINHAFFITIQRHFIYFVNIRSVQGNILDLARSMLYLYSLKPSDSIVDIKTIFIEPKK